MSEHSLSIASFLTIDAESKIDWGSALSGLGGLSQKILNSGKFSEALSGGLAQALNVDALSLLSSAWIKLDAVKKALKATRDDETAQAVLPLATHVIKSTHKPKVTILIANMPSFDVNFTLDLSMKIDGLELEIARGAIVGLKSGGLMATSVLKVAGAQILEKSTPRLNIKGHFKLKDSPKSVTALED